MSFSQPFPEERMTPELKEYKDFLEEHHFQLYKMDFPKDLYSKLFHKLKNNVRDMDQFFALNPDLRHSMHESHYPLVATKEIPEGEEVFIVEHKYSCLERDIERHIEKKEHIRNTVLELLQMDIEVESGKKPIPTTSTNTFITPEPSTTYSDVVGGKLLIVRGPMEKIVEELDLTGVVAIDLQRNKFESISALGCLAKGSPNILSIDLRYNPVDFSIDELRNLFPNAQLINGVMSDNYTEWAFSFLSKVASLDQITTLNIERCDLKVWKESIFQQLTNCSRIYMRGNEIDDSVLEILKSLPKLKEINTNWEYQKMIHEKAIPQWSKANGAFLNTETPATFNKLAAIFLKHHLWSYLETYTVQSYSYDPIWYLMDKLGLAIDDEGRESNCKMVPFYFEGLQCFVSLVWNVKDIKPGDVISRDFGFGESDVLRLLTNYIWYPNLPLFEAEVPEYTNMDPTNSKPHKVKPIPKFSKDVINVCSDSLLVRKSLQADHGLKRKNTPRYEIVGEFKDADIIWAVHDHYTNPMEKLPPNQFINQFQYDHILTSKPYFTMNAKNQPWEIESYYIGDDADAYRFVREFMRRREAGEYNIWIVKPSNLTRSAAIVVTDDLACILKWMYTPGDLVVSTYLEKPALYRKKKFDLRFMVLVDSIHPTVKLYLYDHFRVRVAAEDYTLNDLSSFKKHFTVQLYATGKQDDVPVDQFKREWNLENPDTPFDDIHKEICKQIRLLIESVKDKISDDHHLASPHCKALYGIDVIIDNSTGTFKPKILECNFSPDGTFFQNLPGRNFFREIFDTLFTTQPVPKSMVEI